MRLALVLLLTAVAFAPDVIGATAEAGGHKVIVQSAPALTVTDPRVTTVSPNDPRVLRPIPNDPRVLPNGGVFSFDGRPDTVIVTPHHRPFIFVPQPIFVVTPSPSCLVPGYWTYQWVPQSSSSSAWVPGQWSPDGRWIEGHWATSVSTSGFYQPLWIPERWAC